MDNLKNTILNILASKFFCFVLFFYQMIRDLVDTNFIRNLAVICNIKQIIAFITSRCIQNDCHLLLNILINEHHIVIYSYLS